jgi:two-component system CheB/CheR fusion protein
LTVLLVDDNEDAAWTLSRLLGRAGHRVLLANAGPQALSLAERERPDAAILDLGMPDMDGLEVARRLRAMPLGPRIALIALTGWSSETHRARALAEGFDALLSKPADLPQLFQALERALLARRT